MRSRNFWVGVIGPRKCRSVPNEKLNKTSDAPDGDSTPNAEVTDWCGHETATLVTSLLDPVADPYGRPVTNEEWHLPVIDIDWPCDWVPSTQPGNGHLYINKAVTAEGLFEILDVLAKHGIVEPGYAGASRRRGYSAVRHPEVKKPAEVIEQAKQGYGSF